MLGMKEMGDLMKLMGQMGKIKENMGQAQERAKARTATAETGAGMVKVTANGIGEVVSVKVDPEAGKDSETLGPLIVAATNLALVKGKEILMEEMKSAMGGIDLPPGMMV
jgi:DNA-binding YbaB/EbfC family protein